MYTNVSPDPTLYRAGPLSSSPAATAAALSSYRYALGHPRFLHNDTPFNELLVTPTFRDLHHLLSHPALLHPDNPHDIAPSLLSVYTDLRGLSHRATGPSGLSYTILQGGGLSAVVLLHTFFSRLWHLASPHAPSLALAPAAWSDHLLSLLYKEKTPPLDPHHPSSYRGIVFGDALPLLWQFHLYRPLSSFSELHNLPTHAQGACRPGRQPFDIVYSLISYIQYRQAALNAPTYVFFGDLKTAFPSIFKQKLLLLLHQYGISGRILQHLHALHHTHRVRVLHGHIPEHEYITILKGLPEGSRLSPLLWALYVADLVRALQQSFPSVTLPSPQQLYFIAILLFMDDFALIASSPGQLLQLIHCTQRWCEDWRCELSFPKCAIMAFHESPTALLRRSPPHWPLSLRHPTHTTQLLIEVPSFCYLGTILDPSLTFDLHLKHIIRKLWQGHQKLRARRACRHSRLSATLLYRLWQSYVPVHVLPHLHLLSHPLHLTKLQSHVSKSLAYTFHAPLRTVRFLAADLGFPPLHLLTLQVLARLHCRLSLLPPENIARAVFLLCRSLPQPPGAPRPSLEARMHAALLTLRRPHDWICFSIPPALQRRSPPHRWERTYARALRPIISDLWRAELLPAHHPARPLPWVPPTSRDSAFQTYLYQDLLRFNLFKPAAYLVRCPLHPSFPLLLLRAQSSALPSHIAHPTHGWLPYSLRSCPHCPRPSPASPAPLADELHAIFHCAPLRPAAAPLFAALHRLHFEQNLAWDTLPPARQASLLLATVPPYPLSACDRDQWLRVVTPLSASFAIAVRSCYDL